MLTDPRSPLATVVLPIRDQADALAVTLAGFRTQNCEAPWELIVVDDGSEDGSAEIAENAPIGNLRLFRIPPLGRAAARNRGLAEARGDICILCDADRAPGRSFVATHLARHAAEKRGGDYQGCVVIGDIREFYISDLQARRGEFENHAANAFAGVESLARRPPYPRAVFRMFDTAGKTDFVVPWTAFLSGNVSLTRSLAPRFDEDFVTWGFEHFELGLRLFAQGVTFLFESSAVNFHFAHRRADRQYESAMQESIAILRRKHGHRQIAEFWRFLHGETSLEEVDAVAREEMGMPPHKHVSATYYRQLRRKPSS